MIRPLDALVLCVAVAVTAAAALFVYGGARRKTEVVIHSQGSVWRFPADAAETVPVQGPLGVTTVEVRGGAAQITASPCFNQSCVAQGRVHDAGRFLACLPNLVLVSVEGSPDEVDAALW